MVDYNVGKDFFLVTDEDTGEHKLFKTWWSAIYYLNSQMRRWYSDSLVLKQGAWVEFSAAYGFDDLFNSNLADINEICEEFYSIEKLSIN